VIWHNGQLAYVNRRTASGWDPHGPYLVSHAETTGTAIGSDITTNAAGHVFAVWPDNGSRNLYLVKSTDGGGATFGSPIRIAGTFGSFQISVPAFSKRMALIGASIAAFGNKLYVSWVDLSGEAGCDTPSSEPGDNVDSACKSRVWFAWSEDEGATWAAHPPMKINDPPNEHSDQFNQRLTLDPASGQLGIVYYQTGVGPARKQTNLVFQAWDSNAASWTAPITVTSAITDETTVNADQGNQYGDYNGLSAANGKFFPSFTDRRNNSPAEMIYTAPIRVARDAAGRTVPTLLTGGAH
jgi:hypothetical protein